MKIVIVLDGNEKEGYTATCPLLPGCISEGDTKEQAIDNIKEAIKLYLRAVSKEHLLLAKEKAHKLESRLLTADC
jgi:predicted RNase H-like HicB family nuclease